MKHSKELNDSLIKQVSTLQDITNKQLEITDKQLRISIEVLQDQLYAGRPKIVMESPKMLEENNILDGIFSPIINTDITNLGKRYAYNVMVRQFVVYDNFSKIRLGLSKSLSIYGPNITKTKEFKPKIETRFKDDFFFCCDIQYKDSILNRYFVESYYHHFHKSRNTFDFYSCKIDEEEKLKVIINRYLVAANERLLND